MKQDISRKYQLLLFSILITVVAVALIIQRAVGQESVETYVEEVVPAQETTVGPNCRYGTTPLSNTQAQWLPTLGAGWYITFNSSGHGNTVPSNIEFAPMVRIKQHIVNGVRLPTYDVFPPLTESGLGAAIANNPQALWIVGNEPDREWDQDDTYPDVYARAYHNVYHFIKARDPLAQVAIAGLVQASPGRLQYLDIVWDSYRQQFNTTMPVDVWNMHLYVTAEKRLDGTPTVAHIALGTNPDLAWLESYDPDGPGPLGLQHSCPQNNVICYAEHDNLVLFQEQVIRMRTWMRDHGLRNKPLIISEYSILWVFWDYDDPINPTQCYLQDEFGGCFTQARVSQFMQDTFAYLETAVDPNLGYPADNNRLVQQWTWFSVHHDTTSHASNLINDAQNSLTQVGQTFQAEVASRPLSKNLMVDVTSHPVAHTLPPTNLVTVTLSATIRNNGNTEVDMPFSVSFYADSNLTQLIGTANVPRLPGCARTPSTVSVLWSDLGPGLHRYWAKVDSGNVIGESNENDNVKSGFVLVNPDQLFMPVIVR